MPRKMPLRIKVAEGARFGHLTYLREAGFRGAVRHGLFRCDCGTEKQIGVHHVRRGNTVSCGCQGSRALRGKRNITHGLSKIPEYRVWCSMRDRCNRAASSVHRYYGGRGIKVCLRWDKSFTAFLADMGRRPSPDHTIERIDNDGNYEPGNCRWALRSEQTRNYSRNRRITIGAETLLLTQWVERSRVSRTTIYARLRRGWPPARAIEPFSADARP